ncbi:MAG: MFS transporter, partial [Runella slithyformis]
GEATGMLGIFTATGMSLGPTIGSYLTLWFNINVMFYTSSALALLSILILFNLQETLQDRKPFGLHLFKVGWQDVFEPRVTSVFIVMLLVAFSSGVVVTLAPDLSKALQVGNKGIFFTIYTVASLVIRVFASKTSDIYGRVPVLIASSSVLMIGMAFLGYYQTPLGFWVAAILFGVASGLSSPALTAWAVDLSNETHRGRALATMYIALEAGIGIGAWWSGWYYAGQLKNMAFTFYVSAFLALISLLYLAWYQHKTRRVMA